MTTTALEPLKIADIAYVLSRFEDHLTYAHEQSIIKQSIEGLVDRFPTITETPQFEQAAQAVQMYEHYRDAFASIMEKAREVPSGVMLQVPVDPQGYYKQFGVRGSKDIGKVRERLINEVYQQCSVRHEVCVFLDAHPKHTKNYEDYIFIFVWFYDAADAAKARMTGLWNDIRVATSE